MKYSALFLAAFLSCLAYAIGLIVYRLVYHPLARFPGPKIAGATKWYEAYFDLIKRPGGQFRSEVDRMHEKYGPIVRINPDEVHVKDSKWAETLYSNPMNGIRDKYPPAAMMTGTPNGIFGTAKHDIHRKRRAAINNMFSKKTISEVEPMIQEMVSRLCHSLSQAAGSNTELEMRGLYLAITTDVVCQHVLQSNLGLLQSTQRARDWKKTIGAVAILTPLAKQFTWIIPLALKFSMFVLKATLPDLGRIVQLHRNMHIEADNAIQKSTAEEESESCKSRRQPGPHTKSPKSTIFDSCLASHHLSPEEKTIQ